MLEPGAEIVYAWPSFSMYPHLAAMTGARAVDGAARRRRARTTSRRWRREVTAATRIVIVCNPNNPTATALPADAIDAFVGDAAAPRRRDPRRGLRRVLDAPGPRRLARPARSAPEPRAAAHLLQGLRALRPARRLRARLGGVPPGGGPRAPAVLGQRARPGGRGRGAARTRTRSSGAWSGRRSSGSTSRSELEERGLDDDRQPGELLLGLARRPRRGRGRARPRASAA